MKTTIDFEREDLFPKRGIWELFSLIHLPASRKVYQLVVCIELLAPPLFLRVFIERFTKEYQDVQGCQQVAAGAHIMMRNCNENLGRKREVVQLHSVVVILTAAEKEKEQ